MKPAGIKVGALLPTALAALFVLGIGAGIFAIYQRAAPIPPKHIDVGDGIFGVWTGRTYAYVVQRDACVFLVDAGSDPAGTALLGELAERHLTAENINSVLLTHGHIEQRAALHLFPRAAVYVGADDAAMAHGDVLPHAPLARLIQRLAPTVPQPPQLVQMPLPGARLQICDVEVDVVALPGHTPGSLAYRIGTLMLVGDALVMQSETLGVAPWTMSENATHARDVLPRLLRTPFTGIANSRDGFAPEGRSRLEKFL